MLDDYIVFLSIFSMTTTIILAIVELYIKINQSVKSAIKEIVNQELQNMKYEMDKMKDQINDMNFEIRELKNEIHDNNNNKHK